MLPSPQKVPRRTRLPLTTVSIESPSKSRPRIPTQCNVTMSRSQTKNTCGDGSLTRRHRIQGNLDRNAKYHGIVDR